MKTQHNTSYDNLKAFLLLVVIMFYSNLSYSQSNVGQGPKPQETDLDRPTGCYYLGLEDGVEGYVDKCVPCALPDLMRQMQPPSLCENVLKDKAKYGCCPVCWVVIDPENFTIMVNYLRDLYWNRGWRPTSNDNTGLTQLITAKDSIGAGPKWGVFFPKTNQFIVSNTTPSKITLVNPVNNEFMGYGLNTTPVNGRIQMGEDYLIDQIRIGLQLINPCDLGVSIPE